MVKIHKKHLSLYNTFSNTNARQVCVKKKRYHLKRAYKVTLQKLKRKKIATNFS